MQESWDANKLTRMESIRSTSSFKIRCTHSNPSFLEQYNMEGSDSELADASSPCEDVMGQGRGQAVITHGRFGPLIPRDRMTEVGPGSCRPVARLHIVYVFKGTCCARASDTECGNGDWWAHAVCKNRRCGAMCRCSLPMQALRSQYQLIGSLLRAACHSKMCGAALLCLARLPHWHRFYTIIPASGTETLVALQDDKNDELCTAGITLCQILQQPLCTLARSRSRGTVPPLEHPNDDANCALLSQTSLLATEHFTTHLTENPFFAEACDAAEVGVDSDSAPLCRREVVMAFDHIASEAGACAASTQRTLAGSPPGAEFLGSPFPSTTLQEDERDMAQTSQDLRVWCSIDGPEVRFGGSSSSGTADARERAVEAGSFNIPAVILVTPSPCSWGGLLGCMDADLILGSISQAPNDVADDWKLINLKEVADNLTDELVEGAILHCTAEDERAAATALHAAALVTEVIYKAAEELLLDSATDDTTDSLVEEVASQTVAEDAAGANIAHASASTAVWRTVTGAIEGATPTSDDEVDEVLEDLVEYVVLEHDEVISKMHAHAADILQQCNLGLLLSPLQANMSAFMQRI